ncbi:MAG: hypothetical protein U0S76_00470 [Pseudoxanthomonas sp.]|nr:hypothetical protein [Pseudoxanthomonas sp.]
MSTSGTRAWSSPRFLLVAQGILAYHLILYFCGVLDVQRLGHVYFLAGLIAALLVTVGQPWFAVARVEAPPSPGTTPVPPSPGRYLALAVAWFGILWLLLRLLEWVSTALTGAARWPASSLPVSAGLAGLVLVVVLLMAWGHLRLWRRLARGQQRT